MGKIVRKTLDEIRNTPISPARLVELARLAERPDSEIDFSDIPEATEEFWKNAVRNPWYKRWKEQGTVPIDADVPAAAASGAEELPDAADCAAAEMLEDLQGKRKRA